MIMAGEKGNGRCYVVVSDEALSLIMSNARQKLMRDPEYVRLHSILGGVELLETYMQILPERNIPAGVRNVRMGLAKTLLCHEQKKPRLESVTDAEPTIIFEEGGLALVIHDSGSGVVPNGVRPQYDSVTY